MGIVTKPLPGRAISQVEVSKDAQSMFSITWQRFRAHRMALFGLTLLVFIVLYIILGSFLFTERYANDLSLKEKWSPPNAAHPMGTDHVGRDVMARRASENGPFIELPDSCRGE